MTRAADIHPSLRIIEEELRKADDEVAAYGPRHCRSARTSPDAELH